MKMNKFIKFILLFIIGTSNAILEVPSLHLWLARYFTKLTTRLSFTRLRVIKPVNRVH